MQETAQTITGLVKKVLMIDTVPLRKCAHINNTINVHFLQMNFAEIRV